MRTFAALIDRLAYTGSRSAKLALMTAYFRETPDPDRGLALAIFTDQLTLKFPVRRILADLVAGTIDPHLYRLSRDFVGDTAETVSLLWPDPDGSRPATAGTLSQLHDRLTAASREQLPGLIAECLDGLDVTGRWALLKMLTGGLRIGVSARLAKLSVAALASSNSPGITIDDIEDVWPGLAPPYAELFAWLDGRGPRPESRDGAQFRPLMLAHPLEPDDLAGLDLADHIVEWKWDGIRVELASGGGERRLYSRSGDDISRAFPELLDGWPEHIVADGELLIVADGEVRPFNDLQQRLNRTSATKPLLAKYPAHLRLYDLLMLDGEDLRSRPLAERRQRLETWHQIAPPPRTSVSELVRVPDHAALADLWTTARSVGIEGLMLKRAASPYLAGRPKGHWYKLKRAPLTIDCVLLYAQRGSGKRAAYHSDLTFGVWRNDNGQRDLVPVGKSYSGFTDEELKQLDTFVRDHTRERFGPVRSVEAKLVLEIAFDDVQRSGRHKSGVAMRFPRVQRIRWDKPSEEADDLATLERLIGSDNR